ncbi:hypothetical protein GYMLUDRAFT_48016 [Collybiopsis luxurians FD-317 M1]|uniref:Uncharacterized protein n=1 Tax=Collybiopsis luxurians FD-317 M1 TaxID=944289 RepID=A0A0D0AWY4_9AGAR|nr:hypothetical protein GYMLUDRAFT_48016 [Collybiopsis luxurians FD-317 M1]
MDCPSDSYAAIQDENGQMGYVGYDDSAGSAVNAVNAESDDREGGEGGSDVPDDWKLLWLPRACRCEVRVLGNKHI